MDLSKLVFVFVKVGTWICQVVPCISRPLPNKTKVKFDQEFKACWSFCSDLKVKMLIESKCSMPWVCCAFGNVLICRFFLANYHIIWLPIPTTSFPCISLKIPTFSLLLRASQTVSYSFLSISSSYSFSAFSGSEVKWSEVWLLLKEPLPPGYLVLTRGLHDN